jgi:hypothetical protein
MPDLRPLNTLARQVREAMSLHTGSRDAGWAPPGHPMRQALKEVQRVFGGDDDPNRPPRDDMVAAVRKFLRQRKVDSFTQLKYVCYGITVPIDEGGRLIDRTVIFQRLLELVQSKEAQAKQFRRCYQGLLAAYFGFEHQSGNPADAGQNWLKLRGYLDERLVPVAAAARNRGRSPEWLEVLEAHRNLLTDKPCKRYAKALRAGDRFELEGVCAGLDIAPTSWVWHEAVMVYVHEVVRANQEAFQAELPTVLDVVDGDWQGHQLPALVARDAVALCVARYTECRDKPEQAQLRDACLRRIGNPWLERVAWDAAVKSEPARQMVESWLKRRLIKDFFELLAHDGAADVRRLNYWLKWEPQISDMWFVLGWTARTTRLPEFVKLRERMSGRARNLEGTTPNSNNAFVMRIGDCYVVEFGVTGNACFVFAVHDCGLDLDQTSQDIWDLKHQPGNTKLSHGWDWESRFDHELGKLLRRAAPAKAVDPRPATKAQVPSKNSTSKPTIGAATRTTKNTLGAASTVAPARVDSVNWPAYAAPKQTRDSSAADMASAVASSNSLTPNPREISDAHLGQLRLRCREFGVRLDEPAPGRFRTWIYLPSPASSPIVKQLAERLGFSFVPEIGYYADKPLSTGPTEELPAATPLRKFGDIAAGGEKVALGKQLELLRRLCEVDGVAFEDNRPKGGPVWVRLVGKPATTSLVSMLKRMGFRLAPGKGYYLGGDH